MMRLISSLVFSLLLSAQAMSVAVDELKLDDPAREAYARTIMKEIRCLVCQNQSIEDSNADLAKDLRQIVREQVSTGKNADEIKTYLVERYGDWVLLKPPVKRSTFLLWASPFLLLLLVILMVIMRKRNTAAPQPLSGDEAIKLKEIMTQSDKGTES